MAGLKWLASNSWVVDARGEHQVQRHPPGHRPQLHDAGAVTFEEDANRHGLHMNVAERAQVGRHRLEDRSLERWACREVLVDRHGWTALVRLATSEDPVAVRAGPRTHVPQRSALRRDEAGTKARVSTMATMSDVATRAGLGIGTVSRVLSGSVNVSDDARKRVTQAALQLGYQRVRKSTAEQDTRSRLVGVLVPFFDEKSAFARLRGIVTRLAPHGCEVVLHNVESPAQARAKLVELPRGHSLDGLIVLTLPLVADEGDRLIAARFPTVLVDTSHPGLPSVRIDDRAGGSMATRHLLDLGHERIAFICEPPHNAFGFVSGALREEGFRQAMAAAGKPVPDEFVRYCACLHSAARQSATELLVAPDPPTAIFAASDVQAVGCLEAAHQLGLRVPDDLSVIGYDDVDLAALMGLTTVRQPLVYSGERAADLFLETASDRHHQPSTEYLELELVVRNTTSVRKRKERR